MSFDDTIHEWLDAIDGDLVVPIEAEKLVASADDNELAEWLWNQRQQIVAGRMGDILRSQRARTISQRKSKRFAEAVASGDPDAMAEFASILDETFVIDDDDTRRPLRLMTREDLAFAAESFETSARELGNRAAWLRAIQKKVPKGKTVGDVFTDEQLRSFRIAA